MPPQQAALLLVSRDPALQRSVEASVQSIRGLQLHTVAGFDQACQALTRQQCHVLLAHVSTPADESRVTSLLQDVALARQPLAVVVLAERSRPTEALHFLRQGAAEYLGRPLDLGRLAYLLDKLTVRARYAPTLATSNAPIERLGENGSFLYSPSAALGKLIEQVRRAAPLDVNILIGGETGTGKTRLANLIHELSPRREHPFRTVNCGSLSATLIESEMFGHVKGAFTGADRDRTGKFAEAGRGTLFLDDVDTLPVELQTKLLRVIEERVFEPVGSNRTISLQARLVFASNRPLEQEVAAGRFRSDLFYRINVVGFYLPPLREQLAIVPALVQRFISEFAGGRTFHGVTPEALRALQSYHWPGNVRELRNVIERAVALCPGEWIAVDDLPDLVLNVSPQGTVLSQLPVTPWEITASEVNTPAKLAQTKEAAELLCIRAALERNKNNRQKAAAELGISRMTLYKKLHQYGLMESSC